MCIIVIKRIVRAQLALKCVIIIFTTNTRLISLSTLIRTSMKKNKQEIWLLLFAARMMDDLFNLFSTQHESIILGNLSIDWIFVLYSGCCFILWINVPGISFVLFFRSNSMGITLDEEWMVWENSTYCSRSAYGFSQSIHWNSMRSSSSLSRSGSMNELLWSLLLCCKSLTDPQSSSLAPLCWEPEINSKFPNYNLIFLWHKSWFKWMRSK